MDYEKRTTKQRPSSRSNIFPNGRAFRLLIILFVLMTSLGHKAVAQNTQLDVVVYYVLSSHDDNGALTEHENTGCFARFNLTTVKARMNEVATFMTSQGFDVDFCYQVVCDDLLYWNLNTFASTDHYNPNALNVYVKDDGQQVPFVGSNRISVFNMNPNSGENVVIHEMGHALGLPHTDEDSWSFDSATNTWTTTAIINGDSGKELGITDTYPAPSTNLSQNSPVGFDHAVFDHNLCRYVVDPTYTLVDADGNVLDYNSAAAADLHANPMQQTYCDVMYFSPEQLSIMQAAAQPFSNGAFVGGGNSIPAISAFVQQGQEMIIDYDTHIEGPLIVEGTLKILNAKIFMNPNSSIVMREGGELIMWAGDLRGGILSCESGSNEAWHGIIVLPGSSATIFDSNIRGAELGLRIASAAEIRVHNSIFDDNGITWVSGTDNAEFSSCLFYNTRTNVSSSENAQFVSCHFLGQGLISASSQLSILNEASVSISGPVDHSIFENYSISMDEQSSLTASNTIFTSFSRIEALNSQVDISNSVFDNVPGLLEQTDGELIFEDNIILDETQWTSALFLVGLTGSITGNYFDVLNAENISAHGCDIEELTCNYFNAHNDLAISFSDPQFSSIGSPGENAGNKFYSPNAISVFHPAIIDYYHGTALDEDISLFQTFGINDIVEPNGTCSKKTFFWNFHNRECGQRDINGNFVADEFCCKKPIRIYVGCPGSEYYEMRMKQYERMLRFFGDCIELHEFCSPAEGKLSGQEEEMMEAVEDELRMYPNPTQDLVTIELAKDYLEEFTVIVYNVMGQELMRKTALGSKINLDLSAHAPGIYNILVLVNDEIVSSDKVVLTKE